MTVLTTGGVGLASVLQRLSDLGPPSEVRRGAPSEAARALGLDRVLLTRIEDGALVPEAWHVAGDEAAAAAAMAVLRDRRVAVEYPLVEGELLRRRRAQVLRGAGRIFEDVLGWTEHVAAPIVLDGRVIGFLHGDRAPSGQALHDEDAEELAAFAQCFALVFERAVLRHRLRVQRQEWRRVAAWADTRTSELGERSVGLGADAVGDDADDGAPATPAGAQVLRDLLTRRELDVLEMMVRGETNAGIARALVVSEGTVKFHVKNILRKLHVSNRAEATSRYLRLQLNRRDGAEAV